MIFLRNPLLIALGALFLSACTHHTEPQAARVSLMTWNVETSSTPSTMLASKTLPTCP